MFRRIRQLFYVILALLTAVMLIWQLTLFIRRPLRQPLTQTLYKGVTYTRQIHNQPRRMIIHIIEIDRTAPGVRFLVTPGAMLEDDNDHLAQKTSDFLEKNQLQIAINGDFFKPFYATTPFHYYPHDGDPVDILGFSISDGVTTSIPERARPTLCITPETAVFTKVICSPNTLQAIGGGTLFFENGELIKERLNRTYLTHPQPRTIIALDEFGETIWFIVVDGRQPTYSEGIGLQELTPILTQLGAHHALNLDGGGSTTMVIERNGKPHLLNSPIHTRIPLRERAVGNHIGVNAEAIGE